MNNISFSVNPELFPIETMLQAAAVLIDKYYFHFDKDSNKSIIIEITGKHEPDSNIPLKNEFLNELIYQNLLSETGKKTESIKETIVGKALIHAYGVKPLVNKLIYEDDEDEDDLEDELKDIATPWEEKFEDKDQK